MAKRNSDVGFLDRLGATHNDRIKKREELAKEYEEFKKKDEEKFRNRFADKKRFTCNAQETDLKPKSSGYITSENLPTIPKLFMSEEEIRSSKTASNILSNDCCARKFENTGLTDESVTNLHGTFEARINELAKKIDLLYEERQNLNNRTQLQALQKTISSLKTDQSANKFFDTEVDPAIVATENTQKLTEDKTADMYSQDQCVIYERELQMRLKKIKDAEERLQAIEREYKAAKLNVPSDENNKIDIEYQKSSNNMKTSAHIYSKRTYERPLTPQSKYHQQKIYRIELEKQIAEAKQKKQAEKEWFSEEVPQSNTADFKPEVQLSSKPFMIPSSYNSVTLNGDQEYFFLGQNDLLKISSEENHVSSIPNKDQLTTNYVQSNFINLNTNKNTDFENSKKAKYAQELRQQIEEAKKKKELQRKIDEELDRKIEEECAKYDPFDSFSGINLNKITNDAPEVSTVTQTDENGNNFARGGHGIFGNPLTIEQKTSVQKYKEDLAQQIAEKRQAAELQRQKELELEKREAERLAADQLRIQREFQEEQARRKAKQEEAERLAELQRNELELKRKAKLEQLEKAKVESAYDDSKVHTEHAKVQPKKEKVKKQPERLKSPELLIGPEQVVKNISQHPTTNTHEPNESSIIKQLRNLRSQLDVEKLKVQDALAKSRSNIQWENLTDSDTTRIHPRIVKKGIDLFGESDDSNQQQNKLYNSPVFKNWAEELVKDENRSRLEQQQIACLKAQDAYLTRLKEDLSLLGMKEMNNSLVMQNNEFKSLNKQDAREPINICRSHSSGLEVEKPNIKISSSPTISSTDIEELAAKNETRLKRLEAMQLINDIDTDPEAVLQRFIEKHDELHSTKHRFPCF